MKSLVPRESEVTSAVVGYLRASGYAPYRRNVLQATAEYDGRVRTIRNGEPGQADWWFILKNGRHAEIEIKRPGEKPSAEQLLWLCNININKGYAFWVDELNQLTLGYIVAHGEAWSYIGLYESSEYVMFDDYCDALARNHRTLGVLAGRLVTRRPRARRRPSKGGRWESRR